MLVIAAALVDVSADTLATTELILVIAAALVDVSADTLATTELILVIAAALTDVLADTLVSTVLIEVTASVSVLRSADVSTGLPSINTFVLAYTVLTEIFALS